MSNIHTLRILIKIKEQYTRLRRDCGTGTWQLIIHVDSVRVESEEIRELVRAAARSTNVRVKLPSAVYVVLLYVPPHQVLAPLVGSFRLIAITSCAGRSAYFVPESAIRSIRTPSLGSISQVYRVWLELVRRYAKSGLTTSLIVRCQSSDFWPGHCNWWLPVGLLQGCCSIFLRFNRGSRS